MECFYVSFLWDQTDVSIDPEAVQQSQDSHLQLDHGTDLFCCMTVKVELFIGTRVQKGKTYGEKTDSISDT